MKIIKNKLLISIFFIFTILLCSTYIYKIKLCELAEVFNGRNIYNKQYVYPLGNIIGIKADTEGALVIGFEDDDVEYIGGLKIGDNIISIENEKINNSEDIGNILNNLCMDEVKVTYDRDNKIKSSIIKTKYENNKYKLGVWVRDRISGIGTLTFYNPKTNEFYAIGHGICDMDTDKLLKIKEGNIYKTYGIEILKKNKKNIGQIKGIVNYNNSVGNFSINSNS